MAPILSPFVIAAILGMAGGSDGGSAGSATDQPQYRGDSGLRGNDRGTAGMAVLLIPVLEDQVMTLINSLPGYRDWFVGTALPWWSIVPGLQILSWLDPERLFVLIREHWQSAGGAASTLLGYVSRSGFALPGWLANIVLLPVLSFFFLRDWDSDRGPDRACWCRDQFRYRAAGWHWNPTSPGGFLRGQMLVMLILGLLYALGLWLVGLDLGIPIGLLAGLLDLCAVSGAGVHRAIWWYCRVGAVRGLQHLAGVKWCLPLASW